MEKTEIHRITLSALQAVLTDYRKKQRIKSVPSPSAQTSKLLHEGYGYTNGIPELVRSILLNSSLPEFLRAVIELQFAYGLRISEVLNISNADVKESGHIVIKGSKGSHNRIVLPNLFTQFWLRRGKHLLPLCNTYSRFYFYRKYREMGVFVKFDNASNCSVTHAFRNLLLQGLSKEDTATSTIKQFVGHKNIKSTQHYVNKTSS